MHLPLIIDYIILNYIKSYLPSYQEHRKEIDNFLHITKRKICEKQKEFNDTIPRERILNDKYAMQDLFSDVSGRSDLINKFRTYFKMMMASGVITDRKYSKINFRDIFGKDTALADSLIDKYYKNFNLCGDHAYDECMRYLKLNARWSYDNLIRMILNKDVSGLLDFGMMNCSHDVSNLLERI